MPAKILIVTACLTLVTCAKVTSADPIVVAHRGASGYVAEHTLAGVAMAHAMGAHYIEPDLVLSKDGIPVVLHDIHLESTTNVAAIFPKRHRPDGRWYAIDFSLSELKTLSVHERLADDRSKPAFHNRFPVEPALFTIPSFEEFILMIQGLNKSTGRTVGIYPEIKAPDFHQKAGFDFSRIVLEILAKHGYSRKQDPVYVQCFDSQTLRNIRFKARSQIKLVQLIGDNSWRESVDDFDRMRTQEGIQEIARYADGIGPWLGHLIDKSSAPAKTQLPLIAWAQTAKLEVHPYTLRKDGLPAPFNDMTALHDWLFRIQRIDGAFSDFPDLTAEFIRGFKSR